MEGELRVFIYRSRESGNFRIRKDGEEVYPEEFLTKESAKFIAKLVYPSIPRLFLK